MNTKSLLYCCRMFATACLMVMALTGCRLDGVPVEINPDLNPTQDEPCPQRPSEVRCPVWEELVTDDRCNISTCEAIACD